MFAEDCFSSPNPHGFNTDLLERFLTVLSAGWATWATKGSMPRAKSLGSIGLCRATVLFWFTDMSEDFGLCYQSEQKQKSKCQTRPRRKIP